MHLRLPTSPDPHWYWEWIPSKSQWDLRKKEMGGDAGMMAKGIPDPAPFQEPLPDNPPSSLLSPVLLERVIMSHI